MEWQTCGTQKSAYPFPHHQPSPVINSHSLDSHGVALDAAPVTSDDAEWQSDNSVTAYLGKKDLKTRVLDTSDRIDRIGFCHYSNRFHHEPNRFYHWSPDRPGRPVARPSTTSTATFTRSGAPRG